MVAYSPPSIIKILVQESTKQESSYFPPTLQDFNLSGKVQRFNTAPIAQNSLRQSFNQGRHAPPLVPPSPQNQSQSLNFSAITLKVEILEKQVADLHSVKLEVEALKLKLGELEKQVEEGQHQIKISPERLLPYSSNLNSQPSNMDYPKNNDDSYFRNPEDDDQIISGTPFH